VAEVERLMKIGICALFAVALAVPASAALIDGETIQTTYLFPDTSAVFAGPDNAVVGPGTELLGFAGLANVDFSDANILITLERNAGVNDVAFDGFRFFDVNGTIPVITSVNLNPATDYAGFTASRVTFDADTIFVNVANLPGLTSQVISIDLNGPTPVPEPGTFVMIMAGLVLLGRRVMRPLG
jgi:hypothetical protein